MGVDYKVRTMYNAAITDITTSQDKWRNVLRLAGDLYRYEFDNIVMVYAQRPKSTLVADYDTWKKVDRYVKRGSKGIAIFPSKALKPYMRYVFDISDTGGRKQKLTWKFNDTTVKEYADFLVSCGQMEQYQNDSVEEIKKSLKSFTGTNVWTIIKEDFGEKMSELSLITGSVIKELSEKREGFQHIAIEDMVYKSIMYVVGTRCGFDLSSEEQDFRQIVDITDEEVIYRLGSLICDVSCNVLREISNNLKTIENERRIAYGRISTDLSRSGGASVSGYSDAGGTGEDINQFRQIRADGNELSEGERKTEVRDITEVRNAGGEDARGGRGSEQAAGTVDEPVSEEAQASESELHHGDVEAQGAGEDAGRGSGAASGSVEISLERNSELDEELNRELDEINSLGNAGEVSYTQASLFDYMAENKPSDSVNQYLAEIDAKEEQARAEGKYTYLNPKQELVIPHEYVVEALMHGSGFVGGKQRIYDFYQNIMDAGERTKRIMQEYGLGGSGWPLEGYGLHGYDSFSSKGIKLQWRDEEGEKVGYLSWKVVEKEIGALILAGEYYKPTVEIVETVEEPEEELFDDFAIPDEPESYHTARHNEDAAKGIGSAGTVNVVKKMDRRNFHYNLWELPKGGAKTRYKWNVEAIKLLKQIEAEGRLATAEEQKILSYYVGWGGLSEVFDEKNANWSKEFAELKELLSEGEYVAARATVNNAFYTSPEIASCMHQALVQFGFRGGNVLEPSMGVGNFFGSIPTSLQGSNFYGVEIDSISGRIAKQLYQKANISIKGFEETSYPDNFFDVAIGNVPFGDYKLYDPKYNKYNFRIHDYFLAKAIDQVRPGGIVAFITTKGTLDKANPTVRKYLAERAELIGAVRLPNTAFKENAGTEVTADILFLQKRERKMDVEPEWVHLGYTEDGIPVNSYFAVHPEMMLGSMEFDTRIYGQDSRYTVCVNDDENFNIYEALNTAIRNMTAQITDFERLEENEEVSEDIIPADPDVRNFSFAFVEGKLYYRENSQMYRREVSPAVEDRIKLLNEIREATRHLINIQTEGCSEEELVAGQKVLNDKYDKFVAKHGAITSQNNARAFRDDSDYPLLCSLEEVNEDGEVKKADMFYKQTIKAKTQIEKVETAVEALNVSINEYGFVNISFMLSIYQPDITSQLAELEADIGETVSLSDNARAELERAVMIEELEGVIFLNPNEYNENNPNVGWETSDEYLSGNVRDKLRIAKAMANKYPELFKVNVSALEQVQPVDIDAADIDVRIGTTWIEPEDYEQFIYDLLHTPKRAQAVRNQWYNSGIQVHLNKINMEWFIENKSMDKRSVFATKNFYSSFVSILTTY